MPGWSSFAAAWACASAAGNAGCALLVGKLAGEDRVLQPRRRDRGCRCRAPEDDAHAATRHRLEKLVVAEGAVEGQGLDEGSGVIAPSPEDAFQSTVSDFLGVIVSLGDLPSGNTWVSPALPVRAGGATAVPYRRGKREVPRRIPDAARASRMRDGASP